MNWIARANTSGCWWAIAALLALITSTASRSFSMRFAIAQSPKKPTAPYVLVLGTAQDGGLPQLACQCANCTAAQSNPTRRRLVASLLVVDPRHSATWLIDATPDMPDQYELAVQAGAVEPPQAGRPPLFRAVFLTHAHTGHYSGLVHLGRPAYNAQGQVVLASATMCRFLSTNGPWSLLVENKNLLLKPISAGRTIALTAGLSVTPLAVPHRAEFTDTFGYRIDGPNRSLLYIPDIDKWERWSESIEDHLHQVDVALLDGTFYADGEVPGRKMSEIPHPFVVESMRRFRDLPLKERNKIYFTHLNHTNPLIDPKSAPSAAVQRAGMHVARERMRIGL